jgi:hypothetical protein
MSPKPISQDFTWGGDVNSDAVFEPPIQFGSQAQASVQVSNNGDPLYTRDLSFNRKRGRDLMDWQPDPSSVKRSKLDNQQRLNGAPYIIYDSSLASALTESSKDFC